MTPRKRVVHYLGRAIVWTVRLNLLAVVLAPVALGAVLGYAHAGLRGAIGASIVAGGLVALVLFVAYRLLIKALAGAITGQMDAALNSIDDPTVFDSVERHCLFEGYEYCMWMVYRNE